MVGGRPPTELPPGRFMSQGLVRICPQGFYRENHVDMDDPVGVECQPCNPGGCRSAHAQAGLPAVAPPQGVRVPATLGCHGAGVWRAEVHTTACTVCVAHGCRALASTCARADTPPAPPCARPQASPRTAPAPGCARCATASSPGLGCL
jgi:hypothetical protein